MILHAATIAAFFMDQTLPAQCVVKCVQSAQEPSWKWWVQSAIPVAGGTLIAVWSFVANGRKENLQWKRNQQASHEQWVLDQKKAEWKELLVKITEIEHQIPIVIEPEEDYKNLVAVAQSIMPLLRSTLFVFPTLKTSGFINEWVAFVEYLLNFMRVIRKDQFVQNLPSDPDFMGDRLRTGEWRKNYEIEVRNRYGVLLEKIRILAHESLEMKAEQP
jgi:hypothetical protein